MNFDQPDELRDIREAVAALCSKFPGEYWRGLEPDTYPTEFVEALTEGGWLAALGLEPHGDGLELLFARSCIAVDSAAAGIGRPIDSPCLSFRDLEVVRHESQRARALGFGGKACIHPAQVAVVNAAFTPSAEQVEWAESTLAALADAEREGRGAVALAGTMIDEPVAARARGILARARRDGG